jgi:hypothetical protein
MYKYGRLANGSNNQLCKCATQIKSNHITFHIHQPCELGSIWTHKLEYESEIKSYYNKLPFLANVCFVIRI